MAILEITTFRLLHGVATEAFSGVDAMVQTDFAYQQPGLVRRTTAVLSYSRRVCPFGPGSGPPRPAGMYMIGPSAIFQLNSAP